MSQVLLIEDNPHLNQLITVNLKAFAGVDIIHKNSVEDAIALIELLPEIDIIICKDEMLGEQAASKLAYYLLEQKIDTTLIVLGELPKTINSIDSIAVALKDPNDWEEVVKLVTKTLKISIQSISKNLQVEYIPIPAHYFLSLGHTCCDVFIRIKKGPTDYQFVKRIHSGDEFSAADIIKYIDSGLENFYIPSEFKRNFANHASDQIVSRLEDHSTIDSDEQLELLSNGFNIASQDIREMGFTSASIQLSDAIIKSMQESRVKDESLNTLMQKILNSPTSYLYQHAHIATITASEILNNLKMHDEQFHKKIAYASFFKDISIVDREDLAKITTEEELDDVVLTEEDWDLLFTHALESAKLIRQHPEAPIDIDTLIKHHHGSDEGKGFRSDRNEKLPVLSKVFIIANEFAKELLRFKLEGGSPKPVINELKKMYSSDQMGVIINALSKGLKQKAIGN